MPKKEPEKEKKDIIGTRHKNKTMKKTIPIVVISIMVFLLVAYFIFNYMVQKITEREVKRITQEEIGRITNQPTQTNQPNQSEINKTNKEITEKEIARMTEEMTKSIMDQMFGGGTSETGLKEVNCDNTPTQRQFANNPYYNGPLIDNHLHIPLTFEVPSAIYQQADWNGPILEKEVFTGDIICDFDKEKINSAFGFYVVPSLLKRQAVQTIQQIEQKYKGRITPFLMPAHVSGLNLKPSDVEEILNANKGLFKGFGEIAFYKGSYKGVSPDDPSLLELYKIADKYDLIVMIHPDNGQQQAIEKILQTNPNVEFLFHGQEIGSYIPNIVSKYPNAYYSIDADLFDIPNEGNSVNLYGSGSKEKFISDYKRDHDRVLNGAIVMWKSPIEKNPDKFLWGTDRAFDWHFDQEVGAMLEEMGREFIGKLDPSVQEKFAYKNAEKLLQQAAS